MRERGGLEGEFNLKTTYGTGSGSGHKAVYNWNAARAAQINRSRTCTLNAAARQQQQHAEAAIGNDLAWEYV